MNRYISRKLFRNVRFFFKQVIHLSYYLIEVSLASFIISRILQIVDTYFVKWDQIEIIIFSYGIYQILIAIILTHLNDIEKDQCLAMLTAYKYIQICLETGSVDLKRYVNEMIAIELKSTTLNNRQRQDEYKAMSSLLKNTIESTNQNDVIFVKAKIVEYEKNFEVASLQWNYSIILRLIK